MLEFQLESDRSLVGKTDLLNQLLTNKIGYGPAQQKLMRPLMLLLFSQGCQSIVLGLLLPILARQWVLSVFQQSMIITVVYFGVTVGSYLQVYSDLYGRYMFITWDAAMQTVFGLFSCVCWNYNSFLFTRFFYGVGIGICLPLSASYITQISPSYMRAALMSRSRIWWSAGCLVTCFLGWFLLASQSWRWLLFLISLPGVWSLIEHKMSGRQSLRYLWVQKRSSQVHEVVKYMCQLNGKPQVQPRQIDQLMDKQSDDKGVDIPLSAMFSDKYKASSVRLFCCWFTVCFIYYGVMLLLPSILARIFAQAPSQHNFKYLFLIAIVTVEVLAFYTSFWIMDHPSIGRKKSVYFGFYIIFFVTILIPIYGQSNKVLLFVIFVIIKFVVSAVFMTLYPYTSQIYQTMIRGKAMGVCSGVGRVATTFLGVVGISSLSWFGGNGLYFLFILLSLGAAYSGQTMPFCTLSRPIE